MTDNTKEINRYISQVKKYLICQPKIKKKILAELKVEIMSYAEEKETVDFSLICERFGKPEELAQTYFCDRDVEKIRKEINIRNVIVGAIVMIALLLYILVVVFVFTEPRFGLEGYIIDETTSEGLVNMMLVRGVCI